MWQRWNGTSHIFEKSDDNGSSWAPLPLSMATITEGNLARARQDPATAYKDTDNQFSVSQSFLSSLVLRHASTPIIYLVRNGVFEGQLLLSGGNMYFDNDGILTFRTMAGTGKLTLQPSGTLNVTGDLTAVNIYGTTLNATGAGYIGGSATVIGNISCNGSLDAAGAVRARDAFYEKGLGVPVFYWQNYVPVFGTFTAGNAQITARYARFGKTVHFTIMIVLGSTSVLAGTAFTFTVPHPLSLIGAAMASVQGVGLDSSTGAFVDFAGQGNDNSTVFVRIVGGVTNYLTGTTPWTWAVNDQIFLNGTYEMI